MPSIENKLTGDSIKVDISVALPKDLKAATKKNGWLFNWHEESKQDGRYVFKLTTIGDPTIVRGLMSLQIRSDHVYMHLIESAPLNRGANKIYLGVMECLVAYACALSFQKKYEGNVAFLSKTRLVDHYINKLSAIHIGGDRMIIETEGASSLINKYLK